MAKSCKLIDIKVGDYLYEVTYYQVTGVNNEDVSVRTSTGTTMKISNSLIEDIAYCTTQFTQEVKMTRTQLAQKIEQLGRSAFFIKFRKLVQPNDVADALENADMSTQAKRRKLVKEAMQGKERVMHARLYYSDEADVEIELGMYVLFKKNQNSFDTLFNHSFLK